MRLTKDGLKEIDLERFRPLAESAQFFNDNEHYRLLAWMSMQLGPEASIIDIGTNYGDSALALSYGGGRVDSFDIEDRASRRPKASNVNYYLEDLCDPGVRERWRWKQTLLESQLILIDIDPHEGTRELELVRWLQANDYRGLIVLDDIWYFKPMRDNLWYRIEAQFRKDATRFGHWSGTGILSFNGENVELEGEVDTSDWTLVTGYFDLTGKIDASPELRARPETHYIDAHGSSVLSLDQNLVVFCDPNLEDKIWKKRPKWLWDRTCVIHEDFEQFPMAKYRERIIANRGGPWRARDPRNTASYYLFCMARYAMLKQTIKANPFKSTHFSWINICIERMGFKNLIHLKEALGLHRSRFSTCFIDYVSKETVEDLPAYFGSGGCRTNCAADRTTMCSGFFTGSTFHMQEVCTQIEVEFLHCLEQGYGHADEQLFPIVYYKHPELFDWYIGDYAEMITNYAGVYENPEQPIRNLIKNSLAAGDLKTCRRACDIIFASYAAGKCLISPEEYGALIRASGACR